MYICYLDEAGCTGVLPSANSPIQPVFILAGVIFKQEYLGRITQEFLEIKSTFFPNYPADAKYLDRILKEVKGADIRADLRSGSSRKTRHAIGFLDKVLGLLERHETKIIGRVWIKGIGAPFNGRAIYTSSVQSICEHFNHFLGQSQAKGMIVADGRSKVKNTQVAHSIFTKKFQASGDEFPHIMEIPAFSNGENHAGLQIADLLCSAFLFPMSTFSYCSAVIHSVHVNPNFSLLRIHFGSRLENLQYRYQNGKWVGGITVSDPLTHRSGSSLFK